MNSGRRPNHKCDNTKCSNTLYKRPKEKIKFCCQKCYFNNVRIRTEKPCKHCNNLFLPIRIDQNFCSRSCSASVLRGPHCKAKHSNSKKRLLSLQNHFNFTSCMVDGCGYNKIYQVHRFIPGKLGGEYKIGNMFAICPNHHAEFHGNLITFEKLNDFTLKIV